jgi:tetratricopeptide (TPR) repeat protein
VKRHARWFMLLLSIAFTSPVLVLGKGKEDAGHAGAFLDYAASARSIAMGHAHTGIADDAGATYWNPAGLTQVDRPDVVSLYSVLEENSGFGFASFALPTLNWGTFGASLVSLRSTDFQKYDSTGNFVGSFDQGDMAFLFSNGFKINDRLSFGTTLKVIRQGIDSLTATGFGADVGMMTRLSPRVQLGVVAHNLLAPSLKLKKEADTYPLDIRAGTQFQISSRLIAALDVNKTKDRAVKINLGTEWNVNDLVALRAGINETELTMGLGVKLGDWGLDYAFGYNNAVSGVENLGGSHRMGFHMNFGHKASEQASAIKWQKKAQIVLEVLTQQMESNEKPSADDAAKLVDMTNKVIRHQGYTKPQDIYTAQGYMYYFKGDFVRSLQSLNEALVMDPKNQMLSRHMDKIRIQMGEEHSRELLVYQVKQIHALYEKGDFQGVVKACRIVLELRPNDADAKAYMEDAEKRINEPIVRELKIAKAKFEQKEYLDAIRHLQRVKELDPQNKEAASTMNLSIAALEKEAGERLRLVSVPASTVEAVEAPNTEKSRELYSQGLLFYSQGKLQEAVNIWDKALKLDSGNILAKNAYNRAMAELQETR